MIPTILKKGERRSYLFSREESRLHVQVQGDRAEAEFWLDPISNSLRTTVSVGGPSQRPFDSFGSTKMKSAQRGKGTSAVQVTNVSANGFWLRLDAEKVFVEFKQFSRFRKAAIGPWLNVERPALHRL